MKKHLEEQLKELGIEIDAYRSVTDDVVVIHVDTPGLDENVKGPLMRLYINDECVFENPEFTDPDVPLPIEASPPDCMLSAGTPEQLKKAREAMTDGE